MTGYCIYPDCGWYRDLDPVTGWCTACTLKWAEEFKAAREKQ